MCLERSGVMFSCSRGAGVRGGGALCMLYWRTAAAAVVYGLTMSKVKSSREATALLHCNMGKMSCDSSAYVDTDP